MIIVVNGKGFGQRLKARRRKMGLFRFQLARLASCEVGLLKKMENGSCVDIPSALLKRFCAILDTTSEALVSDVSSDKE